MNIRMYGATHRMYTRRKSYMARIKTSCVLLLGSLVIVSQLGAQAYATTCAAGISALDCSALGGGWVNWVPLACTPNAATSATSTTLIGNDNITKAMNYFTGKGLSVMTSAAIVGNMDEESGVDPERIQSPPGGRTTDPTTVPGALTGWGIVQWTPASTVPTAVRSALHITTPISDLATQLDMVWGELNGAAPTGFQDVLTGLKQQPTLAAAVEYFRAHFESGDPNQWRLQDATDILNNYKNNTPTTDPKAQPSTTVSSDPNTPCFNLTGTGSTGGSGTGNTVFISQRDKRWDGQDICWAAGACASTYSEGCWATSVAMIISTFTGHFATPLQTEGSGTPHESFDSNSLTNVYHGGGYHGSFSLTEFQRALWDVQNKGALIMIHGSGGSPFYNTPSHYEVIRGVSNGQFVLNDPWDLPSAASDSVPEKTVGTVTYDGYGQYNYAHSYQSFPVSDMMSYGLDFTVVAKVPASQL